MPSFAQMDPASRQREKEALEQRYRAFQERGLKLDMSRGKPDAAQLNLSNAMLEIADYQMDGVDCRNYGVLEGLPSCRKLFADLMGVRPEQVLVGGSASLTLMYDYVAQGMIHGFGSTPWGRLEQVKFLCPVPGYDRHFTICESLGIEMLPIPMLKDGPDMDAMRRAVRDPAVKGMFCVPKYSNPQGMTYSDDVVRQIAALKPAAEDFRIICDNAYCVHDLDDRGDRLLNIFDVLGEYGNDDMVVMAVSTSKITFAGAGISALIASTGNIAAVRNRMNAQMISYDKMNQLRHVKFFGGAEGLLAHMKKHGAILKPKFECVLEILERELGGKDVARWVRPRGGYFISLDVAEGCARRAVQLCKEAGVVLTPAGATWPYGRDPKDSNIRIAPSFPPVEELKLAAELLCISVQLASLEKLAAE
ncbi:MAG: aminotransferase class I/II-fold pyridoxal phosphate-dependent enzyme [Clostridiales bacterium]|nr:aminotransferase class I/II-fold pyridoxal phosphate-dependent enzyme [Clostridiales bacterium]